MRTEIENILYEIKHGIFPTPIDITFEEYVIIKKVVNKGRADKYLLRLYLDKWVGYIKCNGLREGINGFKTVKK